jgi:hypothetical protein
MRCRPPRLPGRAGTLRHAPIPRLARDRGRRAGIELHAFGPRDLLPAAPQSPSIVSLRKSKRWHRPTIVGGILCGSVVASTNRTPGGWFLEELHSASNASRDSRCASSMM